MKKTIVLLTRKPGTTLEQFRHHYETAHAPGAIERIPALAVITEITFADDADYEAFSRSLEDPAIQAWIAQDEARFSDPALARSYTVTEHRST